MTTTTYNYDDLESSSTPASLCSVDNVNKLGAQLSILYYFMFLFSLCGNGLLLFIIHRFERLTTVTNILLLNLVVSSLIFMSSLPFIGVYMQLSSWTFGIVTCKIVGTAYYLGMYSSVLFLTLLTFDRHLAVVYSLALSRLRSQVYAVASCMGVWLVSSLACIRPMILHTTFHYLDTTYCDENPGNITTIDKPMLRKSGFYLQLTLFLIFPLVVIIYCYVRIAITVVSSQLVTKFKTLRLIFIIVLLFFTCWVPFNILELMQENTEMATCEEAQKMGFALAVTRVMAYIYFCISPIFYTFVGKKFQSYFRQLLVKRFPGLRRYISVSQHSRMSTKTTPT